MRVVVILLVVLAVAAGGYLAADQAGWLRGLGAQPTPATAAKVPVVKTGGLVVAEARVMPVRYAALSLQSGGVVSQVLATEGDRVGAGQVILRLDARELELQVAQAEATLAQAEARLRQLKRGPTPEDLAAARQSLAAAEAAHQRLLKPGEDELTILKNESDKAKVLLDQAEFAYNKIGGDTNPGAGATVQRQNLQMAWLDYQRTLAAYNLKVSPPEAQVQQSLAAVQTAKSALARLQPAEEDLAAAQAAADAARAARDLAAERLGKTRLAAPFAGTLAALDARVGEITGAGVPLARLADLSAFQIETTDLTELAIGRIREGDAAVITVDALPGVEIPGTVARIRAYGENRQGDIVYMVVVKPDRQDERLRWNMTASVSIKPR